jgi:transcription factor IIIB subunit 2
MNNFRRTVREVVYVVKVTDLTINKRLEEFQVTESSNLTVEQFRNMDFLEKAHDPPAFYRQFEEFKKKKRGRKRKRDINRDPTEGEVFIYDDAESSAAGGSREPSASVEPGESSTSRRRVDADGFTIPDIPDIPIDPDLIAASASALSELAESADADAANSDAPGPSKRPRRDQDTTLPPAQPSTTNGDADTIDDDPMEEGERAIESEISELLADPHTLEHAQAYKMASERVAAHLEAARAAGPAVEVSMDPEVREDEFADDPEVRNCVLSPAEQDIKERIWVHENRDYLRAQQLKLLKKQMEEKSGVVKSTRKRKKKGRIGEGDADRESVPSTPAESAKGMLERRGFSRKINYRSLEGLFEASTSRASSRVGSVALSESEVVSEVASQIAEDLVDEMEEEAEDMNVEDEIEEFEEEFEGDED